MSLAIVLRPNERIVATFSISARYFWSMLIIAVALMFVIPAVFGAFAALAGIDVRGLPLTLAAGLGFLVGGLLILYALYYRAARSYLLTNQRLFTNSGWLATHTINAEYDDITDIAVTQDPFERFFLHVGTVAINTAGGDAHELRFERVHDPHGIGNQIRAMCEAHQHSEAHQREHGVPPVDSPRQPGAAGNPTGGTEPTAV